MNDTGDKNEITITEGGNVVSPFNAKQAFDDLSDKQDRDRSLFSWIMSGIVIFVVITFWIELSGMHRNYEQDKSLMLQNNQLNKDYFEKVLFLNNEIQDIKIQFEVFRARDSYLKQ